MENDRYLVNEHLSRNPLLSKVEQLLGHQLPLLIIKLIVKEPKLDQVRTEVVQVPLQGFQGSSGDLRLQVTDVAKSVDDGEAVTWSPEKWTFCIINNGVTHFAAYLALSKAGM